MEVKIENLINVWYDQIPTLFINLVNAIVLARDEKELREVIDKVRRFCGITAGYNVFCTLPERVKHRFSNYPTKEIVSVTPKSK